MARVNKPDFMAELQSLLLSVANNIATLSTAEGDEFDRLARRQAVIASDPARRLLRMTEEHLTPPP
jgi:hypothetical protein